MAVEMKEARKVMPQNEIDTCKEIGCKIVYGVGFKSSSSSNLVHRVRRR